ncbi:transmembrane protein 230 isoform X1 [Ailuropoda melanoleuca]|uniref:transmembrane protein 230 isoform X1 n=1 Tax=Ailuropoda melanoleuca TaxID=9646 RepID=UPI0014949CC0|nr:transmembrane protein 230 isoform X1 [Ailuropoda melanoleuca]
MMPSRTNLATGIPSSKVKYSRLSSTGDGYIDLQFKKSPPKIPYKAIALATVLFLIGAFLIIIGSLLLAGYISKGTGESTTSPPCLSGPSKRSLFLPGSSSRCLLGSPLDQPGFPAHKGTNLCNQRNGVC